MIACKSFPLSSTFRNAEQRKSIRGPWYFERKRRPECEKRTDAKRRKEGEKKGEEGKGEERSSCVYRMRVEFYACLIWKWIAREYASMRRVEEAEKGNRRAKGREREEERRTDEIDYFVVSLFPLHLPFSLFFLPFVLSLLPSRTTRTGQQTARKRANNFLRSRFITQITHLYRTLKTRYV